MSAQCWLIANKLAPFVKNTAKNYDMSDWRLNQTA